MSTVSFCWLTQSAVKMCTFAWETCVDLDERDLVYESGTGTRPLAFLWCSYQAHSESHSADVDPLQTQNGILGRCFLVQLLVVIVGFSLFFYPF